MSPTPAEDLLLTSFVSPMLWAWAAFALLLAGVAGFMAGMQFARLRDQWAVRRARSGLTQLFQSVLKAMDSACQACARLEQFPGVAFTETQADQFDKVRQNLQDVCTKLIATHRQVAVTVDAPTPTRLEPVQVKWLFTTEDTATGLPGRDAFQANLDMLLELGRQTEQPGGLLLVRLDKFDSLKERYGAHDAKRLLKKLSQVLCRAIRNTDLICQSTADTLGILLPNTEPDAGEKLATALRDAIRGYHFRIDEHGPEVLVTASLGYTPCLVTDNSDLVVNRAGDALSRSQRLGRNQLHVHDGNSLTHCLAS